MSAILVYVTCKNEREAFAIAHELVSSEIAACANIIPETKAVFKWEGIIQEQSEAIVILKSQKARLEEVTERIQQIHSYDLPCILYVSIEGGNPEFIKWIFSNSKNSTIRYNDS